MGDMKQEAVAKGIAKQRDTQTRVGVVLELTLAELVNSGLIHMWSESTRAMQKDDKDGHKYGK